MFCILQAKLLNTQSELIEANSAKSVAEKALDEVLLQLHKCQLQLQKKVGGNVDSDGIKKKLVCASMLSNFLKLSLYRCAFVLK